MSESKIKRKVGLGRTRRGQEQGEERNERVQDELERELQRGGNDSEGGDNADDRARREGEERRGERKGRRGKNEQLKEEQEKNILQKQNSQTKVISTKLFSRSQRQSQQQPSPSLEKEDLDEQPLSYEEISEFVNVIFGDETDGYIDPSKVIHWDYSAERRGKHLLFVEDPKTGLLISAPLEGIPTNAASGPTVDSREAEDEETHLLASLSAPIPNHEQETLPGSELDPSLSNITTQILYLFFQGVLAGFSLTLPFLIYQSNSDTDLLDSYSHSANEIRRFFYILSAVSLTGALDTFLCAFYASHNTNIFMTSHPSSPLKTTGETYSAASSHTAMASWKTTLLPAAILVLLSFFLCFLISFLMSPMEVLMTHHSEYIDDDTDDTSSWAESALDDPSFRNRFDQWKSLATVRVVFAMVGWMGSCIVVFIHQMMAVETKDDVVKLWDHITRLKKRINALQGDEFASDITAAELKQLIRMQKLGVERAEATLKTLDQS